jgi:hypothetical protein
MQTMAESAGDVARPESEGGACLEIRSASIAPGATVEIEVRLRRAGEPISGM